MQKKLLRIIDANFNRAKEALRVCEDVARFILNDKSASKKFKNLRHDVSAAIKYLPVDYREIVFYRDSKKDVGKDTDIAKKKNLEGLFVSNIQRAKESLRVLEESCKMFDDKSSRNFKTIRFSLYSLEKNVIKKLKRYDSAR